MRKRSRARRRKRSSKFRRIKAEVVSDQFPKVPSGIEGVDDVTHGGLPRGRPTLICGTAGTGKTIFGAVFLAQGAMKFQEPGVLVSFEETENEVAMNVKSLGIDVYELKARKKLLVEYIRLERREIEETGEYDLEGLFVRIGHAIDSIGAKRVVLDAIESVFSSFNNLAVIRSEMRRLFRFLKDKGVTSVVTGERANKDGITRHGLEEYISDCVIMLDHRVTEQVSTRRLRVVKYRGSFHGTNEYPFLIDERGISVLPLTGLRLRHEATSKRISTGIPRLDEMFDGKGYYVGSTVLLSGTAGSGKTSLAAKFAASCCERGERALYLSYEESPSQIIRNVSSVGINLGKFIHHKLLKIESSRPGSFGLESHLVNVSKYIDEFEPTVVIVDPITGFSSQGNTLEIHSMLTRMIDLMKGRRITAIFTSLVTVSEPVVTTDVAVSSLIDTWIVVREVEAMAQRRRGLFILKSRGMPHSSQVKEFRMSEKGIDLL